MRAALVVPLTAALLAGLPTPARAQQAIFLVRHAEKADESADPPLSAAGQERARALARLLGSARVSAIYVTQYRRTAETATPLAGKLGLKPTVLPSDRSAELVERMRKEHGRDVVLIVGHSNSVPEIISLLGHPQKIEIAHLAYDNLFLVLPRPGEMPTVLRLRY